MEAIANTIVWAMMVTACLATAVVTWPRRRR